MRRTITMLVLVFCCLSALSVQGTEVHYRAEATVNFHLRKTPRENAGRLVLVGQGGGVTVTDYGEDWCAIRYNNKAGYAKTAWLAKFVAVGPFMGPVPGFQRQAGIARVTARTIISAPGYSGNALAPGDVLAVRDFASGGALVSIMRDEAYLPENTLQYEDFVPWQNAQAGDIIAGFTTFYNDQTGGRLAANLAFNIELAARRVQATTIESQASFSFNGLCAPYKKSNGYLMAPNISSEGKGYGGGVCQLSTTVYNTALGLPLRIDKWRVHRERGVAYVPQYFDAAVGLYSDLVFTNLLPYAVSLDVLTQKGTLTVLIRRAPMPLAHR